MTQIETVRRPPVAARVFRTLQYRPARALVLPLAGAAIGAVIAMAGFFQPAGAPLSAVPAGYVALVNQRPILMNDFISQTEITQHVPFAQTTAAQRREVLRLMIDEELLVQRALALDLPEQDTDVRRALVDSVGNVVSARILAQTPTDKDLMDYFTAHRAAYAGDGIMNFHDIVLHIGGYQNADQTLEQAQADAQEAVYQLRSGAALDYVMQHFGFENSGRSDGGDDFDFAAKLHLGDTLFAAAAKLTDGEISDPQVEDDGVHIIIMEKRIPPKLATFEASRARVFTDYQRDEQKQAEQKNLQFLRGNAEILLAPGQNE